MGRVPSAAGVDARQRDAGDAAVHRRGAVTKQMPPRRRNPQGAGDCGRSLRCSSSTMYIDKDILLRGNIKAIPVLVGRPSSRLDLARKTHARDPLYFHHGLLEPSAISTFTPSRFGAISCGGEYGISGPARSEGCSAGRTEQPCSGIEIRSRFPECNPHRSRGVS